jgi:5-formyltetrahydrofolate cyclo-ligase
MMGAIGISSVYSIKDKIRQAVLQKRNALPKSEVIKRSIVIQRRVINSPQYKSARVMGAYFAKGSEVKTEHIISTGLKNQKVVLIPKTGVEQITFHQIFKEDLDENKLVKGRFRILEPPRSSSDFKGKIDLLIVPGVAFDKYGYRVGYGKGYYDRFIENNECDFSVGLGFEFQLLNHRLPYAHFDLSLNAIATESNMLVCQG